ncbi:MAG: penicillin-binding protein activator [Rhodobacteraceae bacterium]|nr:penicillin-binding protein activator [Paracoccaceae bacterium]
MFLKNHLLPLITRPWLLIIAIFGLSACEPVNFAAPTAAVDPNQPVVVALMVPLASGNSVTDQLAQNMVNAARMAVRDLNGVNIDLRVYETGGNAQVAATAATRAVADGAQIIVGPLYSTSTAAIGPIAARAGINVLSFSNTTSVAGGNIFIMGTTFDTVANRLVGYAVGSGLANIGIVYQEGVSGESGRRSIETAIARNGGNLTTAVSYPLNLTEMGVAAAGIASTLKSSGSNAVFFTDSPLRGLGFITASLGSNSYRTNRDAQFMGLTRWDSSDEVLVTPSLQGGWFAVPDPALTLLFETRYQLSYGVNAHQLSGLAYDGIAAVGAMIRAARAAGENNAFSARRITDPAGFAGVTGIFRFRTDGTNERGLAIMKVNNGVATMVSAAPRSFGVGGS